MKNKTTATVDPELLKLNGKPSWLASLPQALQHVLAMLAGNITPPILISATCGLTPDERVLLNIIVPETDADKAPEIE